MALIKQAQSGRLLKEAVVLDMSDLAREAEQMLAFAREEAGQIIDDARARGYELAEAARVEAAAAGLAQGLSEGRAAGRAEGRQAALTEFAARLRALIEGWTAALARWESERQAMIEGAREDVVRFAFAVAEKVLHRAIARDGTPVAAQLEAALRLLTRPTSVEVLLHPDDRPVLEEVLPEVMAKVGSAAHATLRDDQSITPGGCIVRTAGGAIDATIDTQLERIAEALVPPRLVPAPEAAGDRT